MENLQLLFHRSLYRPEAVRAAVQRFGHLATLEVQEVENGTLVTMSGYAERIAARLPWELANHALFQTIVDARGSA